MKSKTMGNTGPKVSTLCMSYGKGATHSQWTLDRGPACA